MKTEIATMIRIGTLLLRPAARCIAAFFVCLPLVAQPDLSRAKETFIFASKDAQTLRMDKYAPDSIPEKGPCMIFLFGGGFKRGTRDDAKYRDFFDYFVRQGFTVISADYRLGLKDVNPQSVEEAGRALAAAIGAAVEDVYDATAFVVARADEWGIDTARIALCGTSAGAVAALQAEYERCNGVFAGFRYAAVAAFAGAILTFDGPPTFRRRPAPIIMFHGTADRTVPYGRIEAGQMCFSGSGEIADRADFAWATNILYTFVGAGHEMADAAMTGKRGEVASFFRTASHNRKEYTMQRIEEGEKKTNTLPPSTLDDFIRETFR